MRPRAFDVLLYMVLLLAAVCLLRSEFADLCPEEIISEDQKKLLGGEAVKSLASQDVPVGAILLFEDTLLSAGHNTVIADSLAAGHAEINAISNAIRKTGFEAFSRLDRDKLVLVSTYEPCMMCQGALLEYGIRNVYFMKGKGLLHWLTNDAKQFRYELNKRQTAGEEMQDSLFLLHPVYRSIKSEQ
jgi:tRNA(Arg) A34 adenosine deaminase TadA